MRCTPNKAVPQKVGIYQHIQNLKFLDRVTFCTSVILLILMGFVVFPNTSTKDAEATITQSTTTLTLSTSTISTSLFPNNATGTFIDSDPSTISVTTNNYTGYTLGIKSSNNTTNTKLINTKDNTLYLSSISSASTANEFGANNWGYLPSKLNGVANTKYQPAPTTTSTTLDSTNAANTTANTYTIKLGTKIDYTLPTGIYTNSYTVTAVANPVTYSITYNKNTTDTVSNMPSNQSGTIDEADVTIPNTTPTRDHYTFQGWCTTTPTTSNGVDSCSGTTYQPGDVVNMNKTTTNTLSLRAMWKVDTFVQTTRVRYEVAGADGTYGSYTTVDTKTVNYGDPYSWSSTSISGFDTATYNEASVASYTVTAAKTNSVNITRKAYTQTTRVRYEVANADGTYGSYTTVDTKSVKSGGTYSWSSSSISGFDTATYNSASVASYTVTAAKTNSLNITRKSYALSITKDTGYATIASTSGAGTYKVGNKVSISATATTGSSFSSWTQTSGTTSSFANKNSASTTFTMPASAATIKANGSVTKRYMQNYTTAGCPTSRTAVYDSRDNKSYYIQKIGSLCWMTSNLNIAGGTTLTSATSNVTRNYTLPSSNLNGFSTNGAAYVYNTSTYGGYYSWAVVTAGTKPTSGNTAQDICPKGWKLPTNANFNTLISTYNTAAKLVAAPFYATYGGSISNGTNYDAANLGFYYSSNAYSGGGSYTLSITSNNSSYIPYEAPKVDWHTITYYGFNVRCVTK